MKTIAFSLLAVAVLEVSGQFLWDRLEGLDEDGFATPGPAPAPCVKEWDICRRWGNTNQWLKRELIVTPASDGSFCQTGYLICQPVDCEKKWGDCIHVSSTLSYRREEIVKKEMYGGECELEYDFDSCKAKPKPKPVNCLKKWTQCTGKGQSSFRRERIVQRPKHGGKPCGVLKTEYGCNPEPVDCVKAWSQCIGIGITSYRQEIIVVPAKHGGKRCGKLERETGCNPGPMHCTKRWGPCTGVGLSSSRKEVIDRPARNGGRPCTNFKEETNCNPRTDVDTEEDDTKGKATATLFIQNFVPPAKEDSSSSSSTGPQVGERALSLDLNFFGEETPAVLPAKAKLDDNVEKDESGCPVAKFKNITFGLGCDLNSLLTNETAKTEWENTFKDDPRARGRSRRSTPANNDIFSQIADQRDVLFLLDSSGSVGPYRFRTLKQISLAIVDILCGPIKLHRDRTRISMATFNARQLLQFPFTTTASVDEAKRQINAVSFDYKHSYQSCIKDALTFIVEKVYLRANGARDPWVAEGDVIIMTDGCANCDFSYQNRELQRAAYRLKLNKINVYAIGIGIDENCRNILKVLARGGRCFHFFYLDNWDVDAEDFLYRLKNPPKNRCLDRWEFPGINCLAVS